MGNGASQVGVEEELGTDNVISIKGGKGTRLVHRKINYATDASSTFSYTGSDGNQVSGSGCDSPISYQSAHSYPYTLLPWAC